MKNNYVSYALFSLALAAIIIALNANSPGHSAWKVFLEEPAPLLTKLGFLAERYLWPAALSFLAITLFQLQFRIAGTGASTLTIFSVCVFASGAMLMGLRALAISPTSTPSYVVGMALGYTAMARLYAVRLRTFWKYIRVPWPIWRGDPQAMQEIDRMVRARMQRTAEQA